MNHPVESLDDEARDRGAPVLADLLDASMLGRAQSDWTAGEKALFRLARLLQMAHLCRFESLLLDEPFSGLDKNASAVAMGIIRKMPCQVVLATKHEIECPGANVIELSAPSTRAASLP